MRVLVLTGSHGTGKTTLIHSLQSSQRANLDLSVVPEIARILMAKGIAMNDQVNEYGIISYVSTYLELMRNANSEIVISDRSILDLYAYISDHHPAEVRSEFIKLVEELVYREVKSVEKYIYVPIEFEMERDAIRPETLEYQHRIDKKIRDLLRHFGAGVLEVRGTLQQRTAIIVNYING